MRTGWLGKNGSTGHTGLHLQLAGWLFQWTFTSHKIRWTNFNIKNHFSEHHSGVSNRSCIICYKRIWFASLYQWRQMRTGQKKWGVHRVWSRVFEQSEWWSGRSWFWQVVYWDLWEEIQSWRNSVLEYLQSSRMKFDLEHCEGDLQCMLESKLVGRKERKSWVSCAYRGDSLGNKKKWG